MNTRPMPGQCEESWLERATVVGCSRNCPDLQDCVTDLRRFLRIGAEIPPRYMEQEGSALCA